MNYILIILGIIIMLLGIGTIFNTNLERFINLPGSPQIKAIISSAVGIFICIAGAIN
jgi:hypothetical protein